MKRVFPNGTTTIVASINTPRGLAFADNDDNLFVASWGLRRIFFLNTTSGALNVVAGMNGEFLDLLSVGVDGCGRLYAGYEDANGSKVAHVDRDTGMVSPIVSGPLRRPEGMKVTRNGTILVAASMDFSIFRIDYSI